MACSASSRSLHCKLWRFTIELDFYKVCWFDCGRNGAWDQSHAGQVLPMPECSLFGLVPVIVRCRNENWNCIRGWSQVQRSNTARLQFKKLNRSQKHGGGLGVIQRSSLNFVVCRSAVTPTHFEVFHLLCDMLAKYRLPVDALQTTSSRVLPPRVHLKWSKLHCFEYISA